MARDGAMGRMPKSAGFRKNPQEHAGTGAIRQEKTPTENGWGFVIGGDGGNRTRVRKSSASQFYMRSLSTVSPIALRQTGRLWVEPAWI